RFGKWGLKENEAMVDKTWERIEQAVDALPVTGVRVYQDGLPVCGHELQIVSDLAAAGSRNHQLLLRLRSRGAILMGTESPESLVEEYRLASAALKSVTGGSSIRHQAAAAALLEKRNREIA